MGTTQPAPTYSERLRPPLRWWLAGGALVATVALVLSVASGTVMALGVAVAAVLVTGALALAGRTLVGVRAGEIIAGRAHVPLRFCAAVEPLDAVASRRLRGMDADARAFLVLRPWAPCAVRVVLDDPTDPTPYWLVSTRDPHAFAAAAAAAGGPVETPGSAEVRRVGHDEPGRTGAP
jgi:hypothetical protein